jgi:hypothetical protein
MVGVLDSLSPLVGQILFWLAVGVMFAYALLPFFLRYRACKANGLRIRS